MDNFRTSLQVAVVAVIAPAREIVGYKKSYSWACSELLSFFFLFIYQLGMIAIIKAMIKTEMSLVSGVIIVRKELVFTNLEIIPGICNISPEDYTHRMAGCWP